MHLTESTMTPEQIADNRSDLLTFTRTMFKARKGAEMKYNWHQDELCRALELVVIGRIKRLIINVPPRSGKTEMAVINFMAWCMGNFPDSEFIHATYSKRLATANTYSVRAIMQHETYNEIFDHTALMNDSKAKDEFRTAQGGIVYATGADGTITGYGAGKMRDYFGGAIIIDDPHKANEANSDVMRGNVIDWFQNTMESRKNTPDTPVIVIMQRLHETDLTGWLLSGGNNEHWHHVCIPAELDDKSFWEDQFPWEELKRKEKSNAYVYAGQYLQRPAPIGGGLFKDAWWKYYTVLPKMVWFAMYADTAQKTKEQNDYSVFQLWGKGLDGNIYLVDQLRGKWEAPDLLVQARAFWNKAKSHYGMVRSMNIEDKVSGTGLIQTLKREGIPVKAIERDKDKITRAMDVSPLVEAGNVYLPENAPFLSEYLREFSQFPNGAHDDQIDPTMDAIVEMVGKSQYDYASLL